MAQAKILTRQMMDEDRGPRWGQATDSQINGLFTALRPVAGALTYNAATLTNTGT